LIKTNLLIISFEKQIITSLSKALESTEEWPQVSASNYALHASSHSKDSNSCVGAGA
jgi:hypothetical protein